MMARPAIGYSSPRVRRASRPLSMICENPDDLNDGRLKGQINGKVQGDDMKSRSSPKVSRAAPTRKKAVAPLQHPVMALMDSNFGSNVNSNSPLLRGSIEQNNTSEHTNGRSQGVMCINNVNKTDTLSNKERYINTFPKSGQVDSNVLNGSTEAERLSDIFYSSDKLNNNHNSSAKTWSKRKGAFSTDASHSSSNLGYSGTDNLDPSKYLSNNSSRDVAKENKGGYSPRSQTLDSRVRFSINSSDDLSSDSNSDDHYRKATRKSAGDVRDYDDISNDNYTSSSSLEDVNTNSDSGVYVTRLSTTTNPECTPISRLKNNEICSPLNSHRHIYTIKNTASPNTEVDGSITETSSFSEDPSFLTSTPIPTNEMTRKRGQMWNERESHNLIEQSGQNGGDSGSLAPGELHRPLGPDETSKLSGLEITGSNAITEPNHATETLRYNWSEPNMSLQKHATGSDTRHLDKETIEWKRRVKRSISLIKIPTPQEKTIRRRISSINLSNQSTDVIDENYPQLSSTSTSPVVPKPQQSIETSSQSGQEPVRRISAIDQSDFSLLKVMATRLNLPTRRESVIAWKAKYLSGDSPFKQTPEVKGGRGRDQDKSDDVDSWDKKMVVKDGWDLTDDAKKRINGSLTWLRRELISIRLQDQSLARQFLNLRQSMNAHRLAVECEGHQELIDDAEEDMEEIRELSQLVDLPPEIFSPMSALKHVGITRMNISSRRFSTC